MTTLQAMLLLTIQVAGDNQDYGLKQELQAIYDRLYKVQTIAPITVKG